MDRYCKHGGLLGEICEECKQEHQKDKETIKRLKNSLSFSRVTIKTLKKNLEEATCPQKDMRTYTQLRTLLTQIGVDFLDSGDVDDNRGRQVHIKILDEQGHHASVWLYWDIDSEGNEKFVCQE